MTGDSRLDTGSRSVREPRGPQQGSQDRTLTQNRAATQNREVTDKQRLEMFRQSFFQNRLPDLPKIKGYHVMWLTTNNPSDPVHRRLMLGYELIKAGDIPGWAHSTMTSGEHIGCIGINEMVAAKIRISLYQEYMAHVHHHEPLGEELKIKQMTEETKNQLNRQGVMAFVGEGTQRLGKDPGAPDFGRLNGESRKPYKPFERKQEIAQLLAIDDEPELLEDDGE